MNRPVLRISTLTDTGRIRRHNEDALVSEPDLGLLVLADGMGGYQAGEVASDIAVKEIVQGVRTACQPGNLTRDGAPDCRPDQVLKDAVLRANQAIFETAQAERDYYGMGTTIVTMLFYGSHACIAHVGDSRLYRLRQDEFEQLTTDHSVLQELIEQGFYTREEARYAPNKNLVTRALGVATEVEVDVRETEIQTDDIYLLCSDGLSDMLDDRSIRHILLSRREDLDHAAQGLVQAANEAGGEDNISVVLACVGGPARPSPSAGAKSPWWQSLFARLRFF